MTVGRICVRDVDLADIGDSAQVAAERMHSRNVGTLVVLNQSKEPIGLITDRDLAVRVLAKAANPVGTRVGEVMTQTLRTVREDTPIEDALRIMRAGPFRRLPVVDAKGKLVGLVSLDDVLSLLTEEFSDIGKLLQGEDPRSIAKS